jgi:poly(3-hydroxybutyrate) depolymerase
VLYQFHEMQRSFLNPLSVWAKSASQLYTSPYSPLSYAPGARRIAATLELTHRLGKDYEKPEWRIHEVETPSGPARITPVIAADKSFCNLIHFQKTFENPSGKAGPKLLIVAPLSAVSVISGVRSLVRRSAVEALLSAMALMVATAGVVLSTRTVTVLPTVLLPAASVTVAR